MDRRRNVYYVIVQPDGSTLQAYSEAKRMRAEAQFGSRIQAEEYLAALRESTWRAPHWMQATVERVEQG